MAGYTYYLSASATDADRALVAARLGAAPARREVGRGPDGGRGALLALQAADADLREGQDWKRMSSACWLSRAGEPAPADLEREAPLGVYELALGDGHAWVIPTAITWSESGERIVALPQTRALGDDGRIVRAVVKQYRDLYLMADEVVCMLDGEQVAEDRLVEIAVAALATNYRVGRHECLDLELLTDQALTSVLYCLIDIRAHPRGRAMMQGA